MCLAQGHNAVLPVRLEPATPQSRDKPLLSVALLQQIFRVALYLFML